MRKPRHLDGMRFGRITVVKFAGKNKRNDFVYECKCDCGNEKKIVGYHMWSGDVKSCGCLLRDWSSLMNFRHGGCGTREYRAWQTAISRCYDKNSKDYRRYGQRGIRMCEKWRSSFEEFSKDMGIAPAGFQLGRINNDLGYYPSNCRWETGKDNCNNKSNNVILTHKGLSMTVTRWAEKTRQSPPTLFSRLYAGWSHAEIINGRNP